MLLVQSFTLSATSKDRTALIWEAYRFLGHLLQGFKSDAFAASAAALSWLDERGLIEEVMTDAFDLEYIPTRRAYEAMFGKTSAAA